MRKILAVLISLLIISACAAAPKWVSNPRSVLDYEEYIIGIGSGGSYQEALSNAQVVLAQQISVKVESVLELNSSSIETQGKEYYSESIQKSNKLTVDQMMKGLTVARQDQEKQTYWVMVTLNKTLMLNSLRGELDKLYSSAEGLYDDGMAFSTQGKVITAIKSLTEAQAILPEFYAKKAFYDNFAPNPYPINGDLTISSLESGIRSILTAIMFETVSGDKQTAKNGSQLPEPVVFKVIYRAKSGDRIPMTGFPVKISYGDNTLIEKGQTDNMGMFRTNVIAIPQSGTRGKVIIRSDAFMLPAYMMKNAEQSVGEAFFTTSETEAITCQLLIKDEKGNRLSKVESSIAKSMVSNNVNVSTVSPLIMKGTVYMVESKIVEGIGKPKHLAKVRVDLEFGVEQTKEILGTISGNGQGMSETNQKDAISRAYDNISINNRELAQMLNSAADKIAAALARVPQKQEKAEPTPQIVKEVPTSTEPEVKTKDKHWFTSEDRLYTSEEFTVRTYKLWARVGKFLSESGSGFNVRAQIMDHEKQVNLAAEYYYKTIPAEINNIKQNDLVFVFHTNKAPENEKQAKTQQWEMVRVTDAKELLNGRVYVSSNEWAPLEAIRVMVK
ncbi:MAG: hypothetical protein CVU48_05610 [Candidatus Cloacimonetes bacterium HGW-Cloacimonetes-1]|jgi:hypothetical protein|nr:MAG: hypothetical protein CVU48_05610 [Candidatus Cloacimonetes bacterium HGW-Cloacimonetes-1]